MPAREIEQPKKVVTYTALGDWVLYRVFNPSLTKGGLVMPDKTDMGKQNIVVSAGPDAKGIKPGDVIVNIFGVAGQPVVVKIGPRIEDCDAFITRASNVALVVTEGA